VTSARVAALAQRILTEKGFQHPTAMELPPGVNAPAWPFVGVREYWGSMMTLAILQADGLPEATVREHAQTLQHFASGILPLAGSLRTSGGVAAKLGSFGLLVLVFEGGCAEPAVSALRRIRFGSGWQKDYVVVWIADLLARQVHKHRGLPFTIYPGLRYIRRLVKA
jgi:hypothetical protein